jgi:hypothetical protein
LRNYDTVPVQQQQRPVVTTAVDAHATPATSRGWRSAPQSHYTLLAMRNGQVYKVTDYWTDKRNLGYTIDGASYVIPLDALDERMTRRLNTERGVLFTFGSKNR